MPAPWYAKKVLENIALLCLHVLNDAVEYSRKGCSIQLDDPARSRSGGNCGGQWTGSDSIFTGGERSSVSIYYFVTTQIVLPARFSPGCIESRLYCLKLWLASSSLFFSAKKFPPRLSSDRHVWILVFLSQVVLSASGT